MSNATILGIGTAAPTHSIAQSDAAELAKTFCCSTEEQASLLPALYRRTRVAKRGSVLLDDRHGRHPSQSFFPPAMGIGDAGPTTAQRMERYATEAVQLALGASQRAVRDAHLDPTRLTHLITVSCTGFSAPGVDIALIKSLRLARTIARTHIGFMGCHGAFNGLRIASALIEEEAAARALLCAVELCSLHFHYGWDPDRLVANALFADGAAAVVLARARCAGSDAWRLAASGSSLFPDSERDMTWRIGDHGFTMTLSARVPELIAEHLRPWLDEWLAQHGLTVAAIRSWAIHPGGPRIVSAVAACLGLPQTATAISQQVLSECGNMSSPTILFILERLRRATAPRPCVMLGFGPGLTAEAALLR